MARLSATNEGRLADRAYTQIVEIINNQDLDIGDRLPSEARLAETFGMSRTVVREALVRLASDGITEARRGAGSYVMRRPSERLGAHMPMEELSATLGTYEVRFVLESEACRLAATRRSPQQMEAIADAMDALRGALHSNGPAHDEDWKLHRAIALGTANTAFVVALDHMREDIHKVLRAGVDISRSRPSSAIQAMLREHEMIVEAIHAQDGDGAALAMRWHLSQGRKRLMP
ncbi:FadR/GntR family transcriptional regulator [Sphingomonas sp. M1-B02]|uniref:FadR/GntR family transcriptional regulator n=1 Tax=Sphingomonas sp. M1-B02 TaxID=3114300 RepID=UPI00223FA437|nr:FadR/GntR family transcriptional regulator [Sphingomonas sp. S6-11]UZK67266.1 FadR family transcriptional regulator [Sphingomonas sp. S6-11]